MTSKELAKELRNIGPATAAQLLKVGIDSLKRLKEVGVKETYRRLCAREGFCGNYHAAYLYALEGAVLDCDWRAIPEEQKRDYKAFTASLRKADKGGKHGKVLRLP